MKFSRRSWLAGLTAASAAAALPSKKAEASTGKDTYMTLIDLTKCDGCAGRDTPACVSACRVENKERFPEPDPKMLKDYWPQKKHEDWSKKRHLTDRLTPYNWLFVDKLEVEHDGRTEEVAVPRRCMHCDNPPCVKLCPFGVNKKDKNGPVHIDTMGCMGGAKCRTVCPWSVPQRQAGVGVYTYLDPMPVGGGVMYKCDLCRDRLAQGRRPACVDACPRGAMTIGRRDTIVAEAKRLKKLYNGHLYGLDENGGTSTVYVSRVPFEAIDKAIVAKTEAQNKKARPGKNGKKKKRKPMRMHKPDNMLKKHRHLAAGALAAPVLGAAAAFAATVAKRTEKEQAIKSQLDQQDRKKDGSDNARGGDHE